MESIEQEVFEVLREVAADNSLDVGRIQRDQKLVDDVGFRSLDLARIVAKLEFLFGVDPFARLVPITSVRTVGDLCDAYSKCLSGTEPATTEERLRESQRRAQARRNESAGRRRRGRLGLQTD